jgi:CheY-like chemotaxis protein
MATSALSARILIATDIIGDAALVRGILNEEFDGVFTSTDIDHAAVDFVKHQPDVLVLAFNTLEKSERCYLSMYRSCPEIHLQPHRTVILSSKDEVKRAYELCMKDIFDDYILFWPMTYDAPRLNMSVHNALRELAALKAVGHKVAEFAVHARPLAEMEQMLDIQNVAETGHNDMTSIAEQVGLVRPNILVVDDDGFQQKLIGKLLGNEDYHLTFAGSGREALNMMHKTLPDLILMDVMMPDMNGLETMQNLKAEPKFAKIPVIMITGKSYGQVVSDSMKVGAADFVVKPFDKATLIAKVNLALGKTKVE